MTIGFVTTYNDKNPAGLERCTVDMLKSFLKNDLQNIYFVYTRRNSGLKKELEIFKNCRVFEIGWGNLWKEIGLFYQPKAEVYIFNGLQVPLLFIPKNYYVIAYDFAYKYIKSSSLKEKFKLWAMNVQTKLAFSRSTKVICISEATKRDASKLFKLEEKKIRVMYLGYKDFNALTEKTVPSIKRKFFLFSGTIKKRKNVLNIVKGFIDFKKKNSDLDYQLLITGKLNKENPYVQEIFQEINENKMASEIIFLGFVEDSQLAYLYKHAEALVYPSLIEGFGFPILEAMNCSLPVITSNISSLEEIAGDAAIKVDPNNHTEISAAMRKIAADDSFRKNLIEQGLRRVSEFSWQKTAQKFFQIILSV